MSVTVDVTTDPVTLVVEDAPVVVSVNESPPLAGSIGYVPDPTGQPDDKWLRTVGGAYVFTDAPSGTATPSDASPQPVGGSPSAGVSTGLSRADHVHEGAPADHAHDGIYAAIGHAHDGSYDLAGTAASAVIAHEGAANPHTQYLVKVGDTMAGQLVVERQSDKEAIVLDGNSGFDAHYVSRGAQFEGWLLQDANGDNFFAYEAWISEDPGEASFRLFAYNPANPGQQGDRELVWEARYDGTGGQLTVPAPTADDHAATKKYVDDNAGADTTGLLPKASLAADGTTADLDPQTEWLGRFDITDDASPTAGWPDRLTFRYEGERTGWFNEYGEIRARAAKNSTTPLKVHGRGATSNAAILNVLDDQGGSSLFQVNPSGQTVQITNRDRNDNALIVNRTDPAQATTDPDIVQIQYLGTRRTWVNEKGMLRVGGVGTDVRDEDTLKIITDQNPGANAISVVREDGSQVFRIGALGRVNYYFGSRIVGDTIQFRDATEADQSTIEQETGGDLVITPANDVVIPTAHGNLPLMPVWTGTQAELDGLTQQAGVIYMVV